MNKWQGGDTCREMENLRNRNGERRGKRNGEIGTGEMEMEKWKPGRERNGNQCGGEMENRTYKK